jgi:hypothetical protein
MGAKGNGKNGSRRDKRPQSQVLEDAREGAAARTLKAYRALTGLGSPDPQQTAADWSQARVLAETLLGVSGFDMDRVTTTIRDMMNHLRPGSFQTIPAAADDEFCEAWPAYSVQGRPGITICPSFFEKHTDEQRIRILIHEAAHLTGIGSAFAEEYCSEYDCVNDCGDKNSADTWAQFVHCLSGATPDQTKEQKLRAKR